MTRLISKVILNHIRSYAVKRITKDHIRNTEIYEFSHNQSKANYLGVFGLASTGALGIKNLIDDQRKTNLHVARRVYPLYYFNMLTYPKVSIRKAATGFGFTLYSGKSSNGWHVYGCGVNNDSQLGLQPVSKNVNGFPVIMEPSEINLPEKVNRINFIACGLGYSVIVAEIDAVDINKQIIYTLGNNKFGQCGRQIIENEIYNDSSVIHSIKFHKIIKQVECGEVTTFLLADDGTVYGCGSNHYGQLARQDIICSSSFNQITGGIEKKIVKQISCRSNTVLALTEDGEVWGWGSNENDTIFSDDENSYTYKPIRLNLPQTVGKVIQVSAGKTTCAILDDQGQVHTWGMYIVGLGPNKPICKQPTIIPPPFFGGGSKSLSDSKSKVVSVACGVKYSAAISNFGSLYVWGNDCVIRNINQTFPVRLATTFYVKNLYMGADHSVVTGVPST